MALVSALAALCAGCTGWPTAGAEAPKLHVLDAVPDTRPAPRATPLVVEVAPPKARPGFDSALMAYVVRPYAIDYFADHRWADAPARMLGPLLAQALQRSGAFRAVVQAPSAVAADWRVQAELVRLQQDFSVRPSRVDVSLQLQVVDLRSRRVLATREFEAQETAPSDDPYGGVVAANRAVARLLAEAAEVCAELAATAAASGGAPAERRP